jgi:hypothetical protein
LNATDYGAAVEAKIMMALIGYKGFTWENIKLHEVPPGRIFDHLGIVDNAPRLQNFTHLSPSFDLGQTGPMICDSSNKLMMGNPAFDEKVPTIVCHVQQKSADFSPPQWKPVFSIWSPAPPLSEIEYTRWNDCPFAIFDEREENMVRGITLQEICKLLGIPDDKIQFIAQGPIERIYDKDALVNCVPSQVFKAVFAAFRPAEDHKDRASQNVTHRVLETEDLNSLGSVKYPLLLSPLVLPLPMERRDCVRPPSRSTHGLLGSATQWCNS